MKQKGDDYFNCDACKPFFHRGRETGVVLLHGFTGSVAHLRPLGDELCKRGYTVMGVNLPGHATSEKDMARYGSREWLQAAFDAAGHMRLHCKTVAVCGLSMGALLSLIIAQRHKADACVSISAPLPASNRLLPLTGFFGHILPRVAWKEDENREKELDQRYDKGYDGFPMRKGGDLYRLIRQAEAGLSQITCPTLVIQSLADKTVSGESADMILSGISSARKEKLILHDVPHVCTISKELPQITEAVDALLKSL
ncbi:MAG: alpha/beta fold hydrolase [Clostridiales bacterium]|nr:alpha/beta fold hydrolase [Clostridiales bacterium]